MKIATRLVLKFSLILFIFIGFQQTTKAQVCTTLDSWAFASDNGDGTCTYNIGVIVDSGNGASGTATFSIGGVDVYSEPGCTCNPTTITFPVTVPCGSAIEIDVYYDAPGNGNDCTGTTGSFLLPVEWVDVDVVQEGGVNRIHWTVSQEISNDKYIIESLDPDRGFVSIGEQEGYGDYLGLKNYSFTDINPMNETSYYRIKQVDYDNNFSYSKVVFITNTQLHRTTIYPNPFDERLYVSGDEVHSWIILDVNGRVIKEGKGNLIDGGTLTSGVYFLRVSSNGKTIVERIIKK